MKHWFWLALFAPYAFAAPHNTTVTVPLTTPTDTRIFCPFLKASIPDIVGLTELDALPTILFRNFIAIGDDRVTSSPIGALDVAPTIAAGGNAITGGALTVNDPNYNFAYYSGTTTTASSGTGTITFTGDNAAPGCGTVVESVAWSIADSAAPTGNFPIVGAGNYYVSAAGSDTNDGLSPSGTGGHGPWRSISKVNASVSAVGSNVWFRSGDTFGVSDPTPAALVVDWSGTSNDPVSIGTYYTDAGGAPFEARPDDATLWPSDYTYTHARAIIKGTCDSDSFAIVTNGNFAANPNCIYKTTSLVISTIVQQFSSATGSLPTVWTLPLVSIAANYVTFQDIEVRGSAGRGLQVEASGPIVGSTKGWTDITLERLKYYHGFSGAQYVNWGRRITARHNVYQRIGAGNNPDTGGAQNGVLVWNNAHGTNINEWLSEGNEISQNYNENHDIFYHPVSFIIRGNRIGDNTNLHSCIYGDDADGLVIEYNICYNGTYNNNSGTSHAKGIGFTWEPLALAARQQQRPMQNLVVRGNMVVGEQVGITMEDDMGANDCRNLSNCTPPIGDRRMSGKIYNNTFVYMSDTSGVNIAKLYKTIDAGVEITNNIFLIASGATGGTCVVGTGGGVPNWGPHSTPYDYSFSHNLWSTAPAAACQGTGDVTGTAVIAGGNQATMLAKNSTTSRIYPTDFVLQGGSPGLAAGTPLTTTTVAPLATFPQSSGLTVPCSTFDIKGAVIDALCVTRHATTPDVGALETP